MTFSFARFWGLKNELSIKVYRSRRRTAFSRYLTLLSMQHQRRRKPRLFSTATISNYCCPHRRLSHVHDVSITSLRSIPHSPPKADFPTGSATSKDKVLCLASSGALPRRELRSKVGTVHLGRRKATESDLFLRLREGHRDNKVRLRVPYVQVLPYRRLLGCLVLQSFHGHELWALQSWSLSKSRAQHMMPDS